MNTVNNIWLSVLIPTRNRLGLLREAVNSVTSQIMEGVELVISDNASTDGTRSYLEELQGGGVRIILRDGNGGIAANVNELVTSSNGQFFIILHDDDMLIAGAINYVKKVIETADETVALLIGSYEILNENIIPASRKLIKFESGKYSSREALDFFSKEWSMRAPSIYYNKIFAGTPFYNAEFGSALDSKVIFDFITKGSVVMIESPLGVYRQSKVAVTFNTLSDFAWGEASLKLAKYCQAYCFRNPSYGYLSAPLAKALYGSWLKSFFKKNLKRGKIIQAGESAVAYLALIFMGRAINWNFRDRVRLVLTSILSRKFGYVGRRLCLKFFSGIKSPELVSRTSQFIGISKIKIGKNTTIGQASTLIVNQVFNGKGLEIGANGYIGKGVYITTGDEIRIGDHALIGAGVQILGAGHECKPEIPVRLAKVSSYGSILIGNNVWLGNGAILLGFGRIGDGAIVAAGSVLRNYDIAAFTIFAGNPARPIRQYSFINQRWGDVLDGRPDSLESRGIPLTASYANMLSIYEDGPDRISFSEEGGYTYL